MFNGFPLSPRPKNEISILKADVLKWIQMGPTINYVSLLARLIRTEELKTTFRDELTSIEKADCFKRRPSE